MIKKDDLYEAIAECNGERNPNASTCIRLAAFYTILDHMEGREPVRDEVPYGSYSFASGDEVSSIVSYTGETEFANVINGMNQSDVWKITDELMSAVSVLQPRLYSATMRQLNEVKRGSK